MLVRASRLAAVQAAVMAAVPVSAASVPVIDVPAGRLSQALTVLGRQTNIDILFSSDLIGDRRTPGVRGRVSAGEALDLLLSGSGLVARRTGDGAYVVGSAPPVTVASLPAEDEAIPEILVIGRRAQNSDIRRSEDDIQPYQVYSRRAVERAGSNSIDEFARTRLSANAQVAAPAQLGSDTRSEINLRGLGANQTLVLVDGRRLPSPPDGAFSFNQPDLNALPPEMIERIEVLTATAGGIYGTGAMAGAVNVILRRDYRGAEVAATTGITSRGDAFAYRLFGRVGFTPDQGRTDVMLAVGRSQEATLQAADRDYIARAAKRRFASAPDAVLGQLPVGNGINVVGSGPLVLDAALGGGSLGATFTSLPLGLDGDPARTATLLKANAGTLQLDQARDNDRLSVVTPPVTRAVFLNVRHDFGGGVEATVDLIDTRNSGRQRSAGRQSPGFAIAADLPANPFQQTIAISFPEPFSASAISRTVNTARRVTAGLIVPLPRHWRAYGEVGQGHARVSKATTQTSLSSDFYNAVYFGRLYPGKPRLDPFGDWAAFQSALAAYTETSASSLRQAESFETYSLRLAGPVARLAGGRATLALLAQQRRERIAASQFIFEVGDVPLTLNTPRIAQLVRSLYGEARLPLTAPGTGLLSDLEVQLALRQDWTRSTLPGAATFFATDPPPYAKQNGTTLYTAGARVVPLPGVMLRASIATGALPPATSQLGTRQFNAGGSAQDPRRGGQLVGAEAAAVIRTSGNAGLRPERAHSISLGAVLTPAGDAGPRISIDLTRITKRDEIVAFPLKTVQQLLANEATYPERVVRAAASDTDRALGFAGPITSLDLTSINLGRTRIDSLDLAANQELEVGTNRFEAYLRATWEPKFRTRASDLVPRIERAGFRDGPLRLRGNAGLDWTRGRVTLGVNAQLYGRYRVALSSDGATAAAQQAREQGATHIPAQVYADLSGIVSLGPALRRDAAAPELRWNVFNLFDHRPPIVVDQYGAGYSYYGDPRRRRIQLTLSVPFL